MNIVLVDDHQMMRDGLRAVLQQAPDLHVSGEAADGRAALAVCEALHPDVVVMDVSMPGLNGIDATRLLLAKSPRTRVIGLSMNTDRRFVQAMFTAGASGYVVKSAASEELVAAIRAVARAEQYVSPAVASALVDAVKNPGTAFQDPCAQLSPREREVLQLIAEGLSSKEIANRFGVALSTVDSHRKQLMSKLGLHSVAALTRFAIRAGLAFVE